MIRTRAHSSQLLDRMNHVVDLWQQKRLLPRSDSQTLPGLLGMEKSCSIFVTLNLGHYDILRFPSDAKNHRIKRTRVTRDHGTGAPQAKRTT